MRVRTRDLLLLITAAGVIGGCGMPQSMGRAKQQRGVVAQPMPVALGDAVKVFDEAIVLIADLQYKQAEEKFYSVVDPLDEAGDHRRAAEAVLWFGFCREKLADREIGAMREAYLDMATKRYKRLIEVYPKSAAANLARKRLTALEGKAGEP